MILRRHQGRWYDYGVFPVARGRETAFLVAFRTDNGFLKKFDAIRLVNEHAKGGEAVRIMEKIVKTVICRLRAKICNRMKLEGVNPLPWQAELKGWHAAIKIGYAFQKESTFASGKDIWEFKTEDQV